MSISAIDPSSSSRDRECSICSDTQEGTFVKVLRCQHYFHEQCIQQSLSYRRTCPNCRREIVGMERYDNENRPLIIRIEEPAVENPLIQRISNPVALCCTGLVCACFGLYLAAVLYWTWLNIRNEPNYHSLWPT